MARKKIEPRVTRQHPLGGTPKERKQRQDALHQSAIGEFEAMALDLLKKIDESTPAKTSAHHTTAKKKLAEAMKAARVLAAAQK